MRRKTAHNKHIIILGVIFALAAVFTVLRPVPVINESEAITATGIVAQVSEGPSYDVIIRLQGDKTVYYINRGLENGLELKDLQKKLTGNAVIVKYPEYWTPLDWNNSTRHVSKLEYKGTEIYNELRQ